MGSRRPVPLGQKRTRAEQSRQTRFIIDESDDIEAFMSQLNFDEDHDVEGEHPFGHSGLAAAFMLPATSATRGHTFGLRRCSWTGEVHRNSILVPSEQAAITQEVV